jgi:hypothetical protein
MVTYWFSTNAEMLAAYRARYVGEVLSARIAQDGSGFVILDQNGAYAVVSDEGYMCCCPDLPHAMAYVQGRADRRAAAEAAGA